MLARNSTSKSIFNPDFQLKKTSEVLKASEV